MDKEIIYSGFDQSNPSKLWVFSALKLFWMNVAFVVALWGWILWRGGFCKGECYGAAGTLFAILAFWFLVSGLFVGRSSKVYGLGFFKTILAVTVGGFSTFIFFNALFSTIKFGIFPELILPAIGCSIVGSLITYFIPVNRPRYLSNRSFKIFYTGSLALMLIVAAALLFLQRY